MCTHLFALNLHLGRVDIQHNTLSFVLYISTDKMEGGLLDQTFYLVISFRKKTIKFLERIQWSKSGNIPANMTDTVVWLCDFYGDQ